jgi:DMSO/TMAO reductase YedYZ heme-binding membrane subunit
MAATSEEEEESGGGAAVRAMLGLVVGVLGCLHCLHYGVDMTTLREATFILLMSGCSSSFLRDKKI